MQEEFCYSYFMDKVRCQSCGMPLGGGFFGSNKDNSPNNEYCRFCFQQGVFTQENLTLEQMIQISIHQMVTKQHIHEEKAHELATSIIPHLKRWNNNAPNDLSTDRQAND